MRNSFWELIVQSATYSVIVSLNGLSLVCLCFISVSHRMPDPEFTVSEIKGLVGKCNAIYRQLDVYKDLL